MWGHSSGGALLALCSFNYLIRINFSFSQLDSSVIRYEHPDTGWVVIFIFAYPELSLSQSPLSSEPQAQLD